MKKIHLKLNEKKTKSYTLDKSNHVRITGISITKDKNNYRHISVGKKLKNQVFWDAINIYDQKERDYREVEHLKGLFSFILSIEKMSSEDGYSENMKSLIRRRGYSSLKELIGSL